jgi:ankyrin repeat protein
MAAAVEEQHAKAIVLAAGRGDLEEVRRLVQQDRRLLDSEWKDMSPLTAAAEEGRVEVVRYLLDKGADINLWTWEYGTALKAASTCGRLPVVALLLARGADTQPPPSESTPLMCASYEGHAEIVRLLLAHDGGQHIDDRLGFTGGTALHESCSCRRAPVVTVLLGAGADPRLVDSDGRTPLSLAVTKGCRECIALLQVSTLGMMMGV